MAWRGIGLGKAVKWISAGAFLSITLGCVVFGVAGTVAVLPGEKPTREGSARNTSLYVPMQDGTKIALDIWRPAEFRSGNTAPTLLRMTRYWRAQHVTFVQRALYGLGLINEEALVPAYVTIFNRRGYIVVLVDARGSGASYGSREAELGPQEIEDYGEIAQWITEQPWSNGKIGAFGISYEGNAAELFVGTQHPAIRAAALQFSDFDFQFGVFQPGGATLDFVPMWSAMVSAMDRNDACGAYGQSGLECLRHRILQGGVKPVDGPDGAASLKEAVRDHRNNQNLAKAYANVQFRDDRYGDMQLTIADLNAYAHKAAIENAKVPLLVWLGWFDAATVSGGLSRYATFANPQEVIIGAFSHGGMHDTDPFKPTNAAVAPSPEAQYDYVATFFDRFLKDGYSKPYSDVTYHTMGTSRWCRTASWPPADIKTKRFYLTADSRLNEKLGPEGRERYQVDFRHTTGLRNRWMTNLDYGDVDYGDRASVPAAVLSFTAPALANPVTITGGAKAVLHVSASNANAVIHTYLEAVAPNGRVLHLAEGILAMPYHKLSSGPHPADVFGPNRSYLRRDAQSLVPGHTVPIEIGLTPVSIEIPKGYRPRLTIAGADRSIFPRQPNDGNLVLTVHFGDGHPSYVELPTEGPESCKIVRPRFSLQNPIETR